ncbi:AI-2E family transporter [Longimonas halophila]|uniref:AI-2E family transporter n=1 Tax=Longimonas halophila TaxID=1469170 RepID=A0A2H3P8X9_9BACT|nr:AI-2E family transporter [Longimonas halophila]PEN09355.1 AI-2E family transporter [Longimonas halophila]
MEISSLPSRSSAASEDEARPTVAPSPPEPPPGLSSSERALRWGLGALSVALAVATVWYFAGLFVYLAVGGLLAYFLHPMVDRIQGMGVRRVPSILLVFVLVLGLFAILLTFIVPFLAQQVQDLSQLVSVEAATEAARYVEAWAGQFAPVEPGQIEATVRDALQALAQGDLVEGDRVAQTISSLVSVFTNIVYAVIIIPFITFFLLKDGVELKRSLLKWVPNRYFEITLAVLAKAEVSLGRYGRALLVQSTSVALVAWFALWMVGLDNALAIGIFVGIANTIPYFGPFFGFLVGTVVGIAQTGDLSLVLGVAAAMALTQLSDNVLFQPYIFSRAANAHPLVILFVVLIGAQLAGLIGMLVAIPLTTIVRVIGAQILWSVRNYHIFRTAP